MKNLTYAILFDVDKLDRKDHAEEIQNKSYTVFFPSGCEYGARLDLAYLISKDLGLESPEGILPLSLCDFMEAYNNEEINEGGTWFSYVQVTIETQADRDAEDEDLKDFKVELKGLCDEWGYPHPDDKLMFIAYDNYCEVQEQDPTGGHTWVEDALYSIYGEHQKMATIEYKDNKYPTRTFKVVLPDEGEREITISIDALTDAFGEKHLDWGTPERNIDNTIYFYVEDSVIGLRPEIICAEHLDVPDIKFIEEL